MYVFVPGVLRPECGGEMHRAQRVARHQLECGGNPGRSMNSRSLDLRTVVRTSSGEKSFLGGLGLLGGAGSL